MKEQTASKTNKPGQTDGVEVLTEQDRQIFQLLLEQKYLTMGLLLRKLAPDEVPGKKHDSKTCKRIYALAKRGYIHKLRDGHAVYYILAEKGAAAIQNINDLPLVSQLDKQTLEHDLICSALRFYFESLTPLTWAAEREIRGKIPDYSHYVDAAFLWEQLAVFLEVELNKKSVDRYRKLRAFFARRPGPDRILYFYRGESLLATLQEQLGANRKIAFFPYLDPLPLPALLVGSAQGQEISLADFLKPDYLTLPSRTTEGAEGDGHE